MIDSKKKQFLEYLDTSIQITQDEEKKLILEDRKDEANHVKVKANIFNIFKTVFTVITKKKHLAEDEIKSSFVEKMEAIPDNWKASYEKAKIYNDVEKILIEEIKLQTLNEIRNIFLDIWEGKDDRS